MSAEDCEDILSRAANEIADAYAIFGLGGLVVRYGRDELLRRDPKAKTRYFRDISYVPFCGCEYTPNPERGGDIWEVGGVKRWNFNSLSFESRRFWRTERKEEWYRVRYSDRSIELRETMARMSFSVESITQKDLRKLLCLGSVDRGCRLIVSILKRKSLEKKEEEIQEEQRVRKINSRLSCRLRSRLGRAIKISSRTGSAVRDLGCTIPELKQHLESKFTPEMTWGNWGKYWHIDHIKPLAAFDLTNREELLQACHWSNLQPLEATENMRKRARYCDSGED